MKLTDIKNDALRQSIRNQLDEKNNITLLGKGAQLQKQQVNHSEPPHYKTGISKDYGHNNRRFRVAIEIYSSDKYRRDLDGQLSTIMDCLVHAHAIQDDNRFVIPEINIKGFDCDKGQDRVKVELTEL